MSKIVDGITAILGVFVAVFAWTPMISVDNLRLGTCLFGVCGFIVAVKCLFNDGKL